MDISAADLVGSVAGTLTTLAFIPQVVRAWRTRSVEDLSLWMLLAFSSGVALWIAYGVITSALPLIVTNGVTLVLSGVLLRMKLRQPDR